MCIESVLVVSRSCLEGVLKVSGSGRYLINVLRLNIFGTQCFDDQQCLRTKIFGAQNFFGPKFCLDPNFF